MDSLIVADQLLTESCPVDAFLAGLLEVTGRSGRRSRYYYQNVLDSLFVVGLIDRTYYPRDKTVMLSSRFPEYRDIKELRDYCIVSIRNRLKYVTAILHTANSIQPFTRSQLQTDLDLTLDNAARHMRLMVNLGLLTKTTKGYRLTPLGDLQLVQSTDTVYEEVHNSQTILESDERSPYHTLDDLSALAHLSEQNDA